MNSALRPTLYKVFKTSLVSAILVENLALLIPLFTLFGSPVFSCSSDRWGQDKSRMILSFPFILTLTCMGFTFMFLNPRSSSSFLVYGPAAIPSLHQCWIVSVMISPCSYAESMFVPVVAILAVSL